MSRCRADRAAPTSIVGGGQIADLEHADAIVLFDANPIARQHVLDLRHQEAGEAARRASGMIANEPTGLDYLASARAGFDSASPLTSLLRLIAMLGEDRVAAASSGLMESVTSAITSVKDAIVGAAQDVADLVRETADPVTPSTPDELDGVVDILRGATNGVILYDERILAGGDVAAIADALSTLASRLATQAADKRGPLALAAAGNSRGAAEMGADGAWLAGGVELGDAATVAKLGKAWGLQPVAAVGKSAMGILAAAREGTLQGLLLMNHDPAEDGGAEALTAIEGPSFVVLQASRTSPAMAVADVVLPTATFGETEGTLTNTEGRVQRIHRALEAPGEVRDGWRILTDLAAALEGNFAYRSEEDVVQEIARVTELASWAGLRRQALEPVAAGSVR